MSGGSGLMLISIAAGYWVLERASGQRGQVKQIGQWLGWFIVVVSMLGTLCQVYGAVAAGKWCPSKWGKGVCPIQRMMTPSSPIGP